MVLPRFATSTTSIPTAAYAKYAGFAEHAADSAVAADADATSAGPAAAAGSAAGDELAADATAAAAAHAAYAASFPSVTTAAAAYTEDALFLSFIELDTYDGSNGAASRVCRRRCKREWERGCGLDQDGDGADFHCCSSALVFYFFFLVGYGKAAAGASTSAASARIGDEGAQREREGERGSEAAEAGGEEG